MADESSKVYSDQTYFEPSLVRHERSFWDRWILTFWFVFVLEAFVICAIGYHTNHNLFYFYSLNALLAAPAVASTLTANSVAMLSAYILVRQFSNIPGARTASSVPSGTLLAYGMVLVIIFIFHADYSRFGLFIGLLATLLTLLVVGILRGRYRRIEYALVPLGQSLGLQNVPGANWHILSGTNDFSLPYDAVVADLRVRLPENWENFIAKCIIGGLPVLDCGDVRASLTGQLPAEFLGQQNLGSKLPSSVYMQIKRAADFAFAIFVLPIFILVILIAAIAIKLESPGPVMFKQERVGFHARKFTLWKLRSMYADAAHIDLRNSVTFDSQITNVGKVIRRFRIDELPQIFNILRGDMSWIGPRPEPFMIADENAARNALHIYRTIVRPGISGWAQVNQNYHDSHRAPENKLRYDFYYIHYISPSLDFLIAIKTIAVIFRGLG